MKTKKFEHIAAVLGELRWFPVRFKVDFKILLFVVKAVNGLAPVYISNLLTPYTPSRALRFFTVIGPILLNSLPFYVRSAACLNTYKKRLEHLYTDFPYIAIHSRVILIH